jgi:hypothetical protein
MLNWSGFKEPVERMIQIINSLSCSQCLPVPHVLSVVTSAHAGPGAACASPPGRRALASWRLPARAPGAANLNPGRHVASGGCGPLAA